MPSNAVYDFLGYTLTKAEYINSYNKKNTYISICMPKDYFNKDDSQYSLVIRIATDFDEKESQFIFQAGFRINDKQWFMKLTAQEKKSIFFSAVFPFVREKIFTITSDTHPGLLIPIIDMRTIDFDKELRLIRK